MTHFPSPCALALAAALCAGSLTTGNVWAQVAGASTTVGVSVTESTTVAMGWSVKKTLLGKTVYNETGDKVGKVEDLIISPERNVSFLIVGAGGFIGMGRHDVAVPIAQVQNREGKLVLPGATKASIKALPAFDYAVDSRLRDEFVAGVETDVAKARTKVAEIEKLAGSAAADAKAKLSQQASALKAEIQTTEGKLGELKHAAAKRWREFESSVSAASQRLRKAVDSASA